MYKSQIKKLTVHPQLISVSLFITILSILSCRYANAVTANSISTKNHILAQVENLDRLSNSTTQNTSHSQQLIEKLINQNQPEKALEISERSRNRTLVNLFTQNLPNNSNTQPPNIEEIKRIAKTQNATLVQYTILYEDVTIDGKKQTQESKLITWVIKPSGEISMRQVDLQSQGNRSQAGYRNRNRSFSFLDLFRRTRRRLVSRGAGLEKDINEKGIEIDKQPQKQERNSSQQAWKELHQVLIAPIADLLPKTPEERVIFIPQGDLFRISFAALQDKNGKYLIEKHTISTAPSIQVLDLLHQRKNQRQQGKSFIPANITGDEILVVGNPTAPQTPLKPGGKTCNLSPLPGAEREAKTIADIFKTQALTGDAATETAIVKQIPQARIIHFATYTFPFANSPTSKDCNGEDTTGVIALASTNQDDGWLRSEEVQKLNLKADLVVLAGCDTAVGKITGDGVIGLSRAFLAAGADSVVGTLWEVNDISTATLMEEFYGSLSKNTDKASALRRAMLEMMKKYPNPNDWAGFTLVGLL